MVRGRTTLPMYLGVHDLDIFRWLAGDIDRVYAKAGGAGIVGEGIADTVMATVRFASGAVGAIGLPGRRPWNQGSNGIPSSRSSAQKARPTWTSPIRESRSTRALALSSRKPRTGRGPTASRRVFRAEDEHFLLTVREASWPQTLPDARAAVAAAIALDSSSATGRPVALTEVEAAE